MVAEPFTLMTQDSLPHGRDASESCIASPLKVCRLMEFYRIKSAVQPEFHGELHRHSNIRSRGCHKKMRYEGGACQHTPVAFAGLAGLVHTPANGSIRATVVLCPPVGRDFIWTYRALFEWANRLARCGIEVLRFDHRGHGDSLDIPGEEDQWRHWIEGTAAAYAFARESLGASKVVLAGVRIGATLACEASLTLEPDGLILLDPLPSGSAWLRELDRALAMTNREDQIPDTLQVNGVWLSTKAVRSVKDADLSSRTKPWPPTLLLGPSIARPLRMSLGSAAEIGAFPGYKQLFTDSHLSVAAVETFALVEAWLDRRFPTAQPLLPRVTVSDILRGNGWTEERFNAGFGLKGILTSPEIAGVFQQAVVFVSTAANPRSGDGNFPVKASRGLARFGIASLRLDLLGVGESEAHADGSFHVYGTCRQQELRSAAARLMAKGYSELSVIGICTGGFHAIRAACDEGSPFARAMAINSWLSWRSGVPLDRSAHAESMRSVYLRLPTEIRKVLTVRHRLMLALKIGLSRVSALLSPDPEVRSVLNMIRRAASRGIRLSLVTGEGDRSAESLNRFGAGGRWLQRISGVTIRRIADLDHPVVSLQSQELAWREVQLFLNIDRGEPL